MEPHTPPAVAVVTGAARGIGAAIAQRLCADGYHVLAVDQAAIPYQHDHLHTARIDVCADDAPQRMATAAQQIGAVRVLVQAAGVMQVAHPRDVDHAHWDRVMAVNARAPWFVASHFLTLMAPGARVVFVASTAGKTATTVHHPVYNISKAAVIAMTKTLAMSVAADQTTVNCVCPGVITTDMQQQVTAAMASDGRDPDLIWQQRLARVPMSRAGSADEVADLVGFLVSDAARYVTGQAINVCGGMVMC